MFTVTVTIVFLLFALGQRNCLPFRPILYAPISADEQGVLALNSAFILRVEARLRALLMRQAWLNASEAEQE